MQQQGPLKFLNATAKTARFLMPRTLEIAFSSFQISNFSSGQAPRPPLGKKGLTAPFKWSQPPITPSVAASVTNASSTGDLSSTLPFFPCQTVRILLRFWLISSHISKSRSKNKLLLTSISKQSSSLMLILTSFFFLQLNWSHS